MGFKIMVGHLLKWFEWDKEIIPGSGAKIK
ncbi:Protein of unknown function [Bacillus mycoides]|nr:Protein of unknown function [Bacillus mycoides]